MYSGAGTAKEKPREESPCGGDRGDIRGEEAQFSNRSCVSLHRPRRVSTPVDEFTP